jgi:hypothetical protein
VTSIFCHQFWELFCPDTGIGVSALVFLGTVSFPGVLNPGTCLQISGSHFLQGGLEMILGILIMLAGLGIMTEHTTLAGIIFMAIGVYNMQHSRHK